MPLYDYVCHHCEIIKEVFHKISEEVLIDCPDCGAAMEKAITLGHGGIRVSDPSWVQNINGVVNDLEFVNRGKQERITTREQARRKIAEMYADTMPETQHSKNPRDW